MTFYEASVRARSLLIDAGILPETATLDADLLARHAVGWDHATWLARRSEPATDEFTTRYEHVIKRRIDREPVAYIRGVQEFWGRDFVVSRAVLIPRPETELLIEHASEYLKTHPDAHVVDVGTGSGCIAVTLTLDHPDITMFAVDISEEALSLARANAVRLGASGIRFIHGSNLAETPRPVHLIAANPPYVAERDKAGLTPEVRDYEPAVALYGGNDGWDNIRALLKDAETALAPGGVMLMELGYGQSERIADEVRAASKLQLREIHADLQGIARLAEIIATE